LGHVYPWKIVAAQMFKHFVVRHYDQDLEAKFESICAQLFQGDYLVVKEYRPKEHYHFQGTTIYSDSAFEKMQQELITKEHRFRKERPGARLCVNSKKEVNEKGFQYMCKQKDCMIVATNLTDDVISKLQEASDLHVEALKNELKEYVYPKIDADWRDLLRGGREGGRRTELLKEMVTKVKSHIVDFMFEQGKQIAFARLKERALNLIMYHPKCDATVRHLLHSI